MKKNSFTIILGLIIIAGGILYGLHITGIWNLNISFDGWWTLFIIIPGILSIITNGPHIFNLAVTGIGLMFLLTEQGVLKDDLGYKLVAPIIIVSVGLGLVLKKSSPPFDGNTGLFAGNRGTNYFAIFGGNSPQFAGTVFKGASTFAIFGGIDLKLQNAIINKTCLINTYSIFGGTDIILPPNVKASVTCTPVFGGVENRFISSSEDKAPIVYIRAICVFGGTDIK